MSEDRSRPNVLARITDSPHLARAVPLLRPEVLHAVITHCGLHDSGELLALATPEQLSAVFDLDLWKASPGSEEQFDADRFGEWLEVLVDLGPEIAATRLAGMDAALVVAGLSPNITVFDLAAFSSDGEPSGADGVVDAGRERGLHAQIGGYIVVARRHDAWEPIVEALLALAEHHAETFHRVMSACRRLSNAGFELDGLDDLLSDAEQVRFDLSLSRERRRDLLGFLPPLQARAFLDAARRTSDVPPDDDPVFISYQRSSTAAEIDAAAEFARGDAVEAGDDTAPAVADVIEVLRTGGILSEAPRALLPGVQDDAPSLHPALGEYLRRCEEARPDCWAARDQELAFLANALVAGCSVQGRPFSRREAMDAVLATCNLGLDSWPPRWPPSSQHDLVTIFRVGWTTLHREVSMEAAGHLLRELDEVRTGDRDLQSGLHVLRRELHKARQAATPWRARQHLDVLAPLDLPAWAALTALLDECPVMLANVCAPSGRRPHTLNPSAFQFIADAKHVAAVHEFLQSLGVLLTS